MSHNLHNISESLNGHSYLRNGFRPTLYLSSRKITKENEKTLEALVPYHRWEDYTIRY